MRADRKPGLIERIRDDEGKLHTSKVTSLWLEIWGTTVLKSWLRENDEMRGAKKGYSRDDKLLRRNWTSAII